MDENQNPNSTPPAPVAQPVAPAMPAPMPVAAPAAPAKPVVVRQPMPMGTVLTLIVVIALIIVAALYFWGQKVANETVPVPAAQTTGIEVDAAVPQPN